MLPAILGFAAQSLIPTTIMPAFMAGALGSGIGSLLQGGSGQDTFCLLYTSPSPRDGLLSRMPSSA